MESTTPRLRGNLEKNVTDGTPSDVVERYASLKNLADRLDFGALDENVVVLDTETTGLSFSHDELIQVAAARMSHGKIESWFVSFANPGKPIPEEIEHLTHISNSDVAEAPAPDEVMRQLVEFVGDARIVAHNAEFDRTFTTKYPAGKALLENEWIDSLDLSRIALPRLKSHRLIDLVKAFDAPLSTHRADADVEATCSLFRVLLAAVCSMPRSLVAEIATMADKDQWPTVVVFDYLLHHAPSGSPLADSAEAPAETGEAECEGEKAESAAKTPLFSLRSMRRQRVNSCLPARPSSLSGAAVLDDETPLLDVPSRADIDRAFSAEGLLGRIYGSYDPRPEQLEMAEAVRSAFERSNNLVVEAGTGVGKSMAYLVPSALTSLRSGVAIGVATNTNALLDQLVFSELPALSHALQQEAPDLPELSYAALKGISHYPCLRKIEKIAADGPSTREVAGRQQNQAPALAALLSYIEQSEFSDLDALKIDYRLLPRWAITTTSNDCLRRKCPYFGSLCFGHGARRRAERCNIVVTNHALLCCDLAADGGLLPRAACWVVDEAHGIEAEARRAFTKKVDSDALSRLCGRVAPSGSSRTIFARAEKRVSGDVEESAALFYGLSNKAQEAGDAFARAAEEYCLHVKDLLYFDTQKTGRSYESVDLWLNGEVRRSSVFAGLKSHALVMVEAAEKLVRRCQDLVAFLEGIDAAAEPQREIASTAIELKELIEACDLIFGKQPESFVFQASLLRKKDRLGDSLGAMPLEVGSMMRDAFYSRTQSVVYASATLSVDGRFEAFSRAVGLNEDESSFARELQVDSSFDFDNNMIVYVASDMPEPNAPSYLAALQKLLVGVHLAQGGSMLTLFTNRREMERCFDEVWPLMKREDLRLVCQKWGVSSKALRDDFIADESLSLFALKSFWQGFDAPGSTLRGVVIPKLPFSRPTDPLSCERASRDDRAWFKYTLPQAVIETKQAAGRLIRKSDDTGVVILADKRLVTKSYGKTVLNSLQSKTVRICPTSEIVASLAAMNGR